MNGCYVIVIFTFTRVQNDVKIEESSQGEEEARAQVSWVGLGWVRDKLTITLSRSWRRGTK